MNEAKLPSIETALNIKVESYGKQYRADAQILPGSPTVGIGKSADAAKYNLLVNLIYIVAQNDPRSPDYAYRQITLNAIKNNWDNFIKYPGVSL